MKENLLSRNNSLVLRGAAIMFIMLHNFLHIELFGFSAENEMSFSLVNANSFFDSLLSGTNVVGEFFFHLGWIGVPVFVFLTGYGAARSVPPMNANESCSYIKRNYMKLLALMLPAVLFFVGLDILKGNSEVFRWMGRLSACIFVCHPIARLVVRNALYPRFSNLIVNVLAYVILTIIISWFYNKIYQWLLAKMSPKKV